MIPVMDVRRRHRPQRLRLLGAIAAGVVLSATALTGCGSDDDSSDAPEFAVELGRYVIIPDVLNVPVGEVDLRVTNTDSMVHNLVVAGRGTRNLNPGESQLITVHVQAASYRMWCDVPGHADLGQTGTLNAAPTNTAPLDTAG